MALFTFRSRLSAERLIQEINSLNQLAEGSVDYEIISDLYEEALDRYVQCRHRNCGLCNGVGCENSVQVEIPEHLLMVTYQQRKLAAEKITEAQASMWYADDIGLCHR